MPFELQLKRTRFEPYDEDGSVIIDDESINRYVALFAEKTCDNMLN